MSNDMSTVRSAGLSTGLSDAKGKLLEAAQLYAVGADLKDADLWRRVLAEECEIIGPGFHHQGRETCLGSIAALGQMFRATQHKIHQQVVTVESEKASGVTYATADHLMLDEDIILVWNMRYLDSWRQVGEDWLFTRRELIVDWQESRPVQLLS